MCDVRQVKNSFKKLMKACVPSSATSEPGMTFHRCLEESEWMCLVMLSFIQCVLACATVKVYVLCNRETYGYILFLCVYPDSA